MVSLWVQILVEFHSTLVCVAPCHSVLLSSPSAFGRTIFISNWCNIFQYNVFSPEEAFSIALVQCNLVSFPIYGRIMKSQPICTQNDILIAYVCDKISEPFQMLITIDI